MIPFLTLIIARGWEGLKKYVLHAWGYDVVCMAVAALFQLV